MHALNKPIVKYDFAGHDSGSLVISPAHLEIWTWVARSRASGINHRSEEDATGGGTRLATIFDCREYVMIITYSVVREINKMERW